jgi:hypothetical protein
MWGGVGGSPVLEQTMLLIPNDDGELLLARSDAFSARGRGDASHLLCYSETKRPETRSARFVVGTRLKNLVTDARELGELSNGWGRGKEDITEIVGSYENHTQRTGSTESTRAIGCRI